MCGEINCNGIPEGVKAYAAGKEQIIIGCCKVQDGYYCIWNLEHMNMVCEEWAEICDLRKIIHEVRHISFNVVSERQLARTALNNLKKDAPFNECQRFPWRKVYVNLSCGIYATLWENLLSALDFKDREAEKEMKYGKPKIASDEDHHSRNEYSLDDAKTQFRNNIKKFINELCKRNEMFDRIKFEAEYNLTWCLGPCPQEPKPSDPEDPEVRDFSSLMKALKNLDLNPRDFEVFGPSDIKKGDFGCSRQTQELGPGLEGVKFPKGSKYVHVFTSGEYSKCLDINEQVSGYTYNIETGKLIGPRDLKSNSIEFKKDFKKFVESSDVEDIMWRIYNDIPINNKWPNSKAKFNFSKRSEKNKVPSYAEVVSSGSRESEYSIVGNKSSSEDVEE